MIKVYMWFRVAVFHCNIHMLLLLCKTRILIVDVVVL